MTIAANMKRNDDGSPVPGTIVLTTDAGTLELGNRLWKRFTQDMEKDPSMARARLISGIQVSIRDALRDGWTVDPIWR